TANSLMGSVRFGVGAVMGSLVASFKMETAAPMLYTMTACVVISALSYYFLTYRNER
ncbi:MAG: Bcr/CflA family multidrug efflux transporter, partial [Haemophilus parainfluenzae]|nr:Bcr/CflA family multidrug efflux transporter [Haemophilus parainfluenzae]